MTYITDHTTPYPKYSNDADKVTQSIDNTATQLANLSNVVTGAIHSSSTTVTKNMKQEEIWLQIFCALISNSASGVKLALPSYAKLADQALEEFNNRYPF